MAVTLQEPSPIELFQLLAEPVRWQLVQVLGKSDRRVNELSELTGKPQNLVSYHLRELRSAGLVTSRRSSFDGRDTYYRVDLERFAQLLGEAGAALQPGLRVDLPPPSDRRNRPARVLFLCTGNSARSQMAEALIVHRSGGAVEARSAGSAPKALHPNAVRVMAERGIDISANTTKHLRHFERMRFDQVITLCDRVREVCPEFPHHPSLAHWSVADPALSGEDDDLTYPAFEQTAQELDSRIGLLLPRLLAPAHNQEASHAR